VIDEASEDDPEFELNVELNDELNQKLQEKVNYDTDSHDNRSEYDQEEYVYGSEESDEDSEN